MPTTRGTKKSKAYPTEAKPYMRVAAARQNCRDPVVDKETRELLTALRERYDLEITLTKLQEQVKDLEKKIHEMDAKVVKLFTGLRVHIDTPIL